MEGNRFSFCPQCGSKGVQTLLGGRKWYCPECGFDLYNNVASATGLLIENERGEILFEKRAKEPRKGFLAFPGGFSEPDETGESAAIRECEEEIGVKPVSVEYLCSFPNTYEYRGITYKTCDLFFTATLPPAFELHAQKGEVDGFVWLPVRTAADVENAPLAFDSARRTLLCYIERKYGGRK